MPLQDHFHPPLTDYTQWHSIHSAWATAIAFALDDELPSGFHALPTVQFEIEIDVAAFEQTAPGAPTQAVPQSWTPPSPTATVPFTIVTDVVEIKLFRKEGGWILAGAIELVSTANKDRPATRDAFVSKCAAYVQQGIGLIIVDIVTERQANLHDELMARLQTGLAPLGANLYGTAYRPNQHDGQPELQVWQETLAIGAVLPTLPLCLQRGPCIPVNLESTYNYTMRKLRLTANGA